MSATDPSPKQHQHTRRIPQQSLFYDRLFPLILIGLGIVMIALIIIAAGVLLGYVHYQ